MWIKVDTGRWIREHSDDSTAYLLAAGGRLLELHVEAGSATLHEYLGTAVDDRSPLATAVYRRTENRPDLVVLDASQAWSALGSLFERMADGPAGKDA